MTGYGKDKGIKILLTPQELFGSLVRSYQVRQDHVSDTFASENHGKSEKEKHIHVAVPLDRHFSVSFLL